MRLNYFFLPPFLLMFVLSATAQNKKQAKTDAPVFTYVEQMPESGYDYNKYLAENFHYPDSAIAHNIEGRVIIKFVVTETGEITDCELLRGIDKDCDEEALRVIRKMPRWKPGKQNGKAVKVFFTIPIVFKLTD